MNDEMFRDWSDSGVAIVRELLPRLLQHGAEFYKTRLPKHVRVRVPNAVVDELVIQLTDRPKSSAVLFKLTVGDKHPDIGDDGTGRPLVRSKSSDGPSERNRGTTTVSLTDVAGPILGQIDAAYEFCTGRKPVPRRAAPTPPAAAAEEGNDTADDGLDHRETVSRQIRRRRGQQKFRDELRKRFGNRCAITDCVVLDVLEAAHIKPYRAGERDNAADNGLLLRADIHTLFDLDRIGIHPDTLRIELHPELTASPEYGPLAGGGLHCPNGRPRTAALNQRYDEFRKACGSG